MPRPTVHLIALAALAVACKGEEVAVGKEATDTSELLPPGTDADEARTARPADRMRALRMPSEPVRR